ncbi:hypothetical protein [Phytobacter sp. V91]|uniref:hypothetical protein n=1 Tax=Phytobacter sp. V91 TaxID=3369425 RepID=UPI003F5DE15B
MRWILYKKKWHRLTTIISGHEYRLAIPEERTAVTVDRNGLGRVVRAHYGLNTHSA